MVLKRLFLDIYFILLSGSCFPVSLHDCELLLKIGHLQKQLPLPGFAECHGKTSTDLQVLEPWYQSRVIASGFFRSFWTLSCLDLCMYFFPPVLQTLQKKKKIKQSSSLEIHLRGTFYEIYILYIYIFLVFL